MIEFELVERQLADKEDDSHSWTIHVKKLLNLYNLPKPLELLYSVTSKERWHDCVIAKMHKV